MNENSKNMSNDLITLNSNTLSKNEIETITIKGSSSKIYENLLKYVPRTAKEIEFFKNFEKAMNLGVNSFKIPVNDPSIDKNGKIQFVAGEKPAVGYSYNQLEEMSNEIGYRVGTRHEHSLFIGTMIIRMLDDNWSMNSAWNVMCNDSKVVGNYRDPEKFTRILEKTGSRCFYGKCDMANTIKVLAKEGDHEDFFIASACCNFFSDRNPVSDICFTRGYGHRWEFAVGWFVTNI